MASASGSPKPNSGAFEQALTVFPAFGIPVEVGAHPSFSTPWRITEQAAQARLMYLDNIEAWLTASRRVIDYWRTSVREQQDALLARWRAQIVESAADSVSGEAPYGQLSATAPVPQSVSKAAGVETRARQPARVGRKDGRACE